MQSLPERFLAFLFNHLSERPPPPHALHLGYRTEGSHSVLLSETERLEHVTVLGKTGAGKSSLLSHLATQDIQARRGFLFIDLHGDLTPHLLRLVARAEDNSGTDLSNRSILIDPTDRDRSVGLNILTAGDEQQSFVIASEIVQLLKERWGLEVFGARTEELLRNALLVLIENGLTFVDLPPLLTSAHFRSRLVARVKNVEVRSYFQNRFDRASPALQAVMREAVLNKATTFTADPHFRHLLGQTTPRLNLLDAVDRGAWVILSLNKGRLGEEVTTLGALILSHLKHLLFRRQSRELFTIYADELQNLVSIEHGTESLFAEARKFGVSIVSANQFLDQYPPETRSAVLAAGAQILFRLSGPDALWLSTILGGGQNLSDLLQLLPTRQFLLKRSTESVEVATVPEISAADTDFVSLVDRVRKRWTVPRIDVEEAIATRAGSEVGKEVLDGWE